MCPGLSNEISSPPSQPGDFPAQLLLSRCAKLFLDKNSVPWVTQAEGRK